MPHLPPLNKYQWDCLCETTALQTAHLNMVFTLVIHVTVQITRVLWWLWQWEDDNVSRLIQIAAKWSPHYLCNQGIYYAMMHVSVFSCMIPEIESAEDHYCISSLLECETMLIKWVRVPKAPTWHCGFLKVSWKYQICFVRKFEYIPYESLFICKHCMHKNTDIVLLHIQSVDMERYQKFSRPCSVMSVHKITVE